MDTATNSTPPTITYDDFAKIDLRVATIRETRLPAKGDKLIVLQVELENGERRQILAGIRKDYTPEQLVGKQIIVVANLAPRTVLGEESRGMLLAATDSATGKVVVLSPSEPVGPGSKVK